MLPKPQRSVPSADFTADFISFDERSQAQMQEPSSQEESEAADVSPEEALKRTINSVVYSVPPWLQKDSSFSIAAFDGPTKTHHMKYHQEVISFMNWAMVHPGSEEMELRQALFHRIEFQIKFIYPEARCFMFGSTASGLALQGSDIDMVVFCHSKNFLNMVEGMQQRLMKVKAFEYVELIRASVPILKIKDNKSGVCADIAFNREDGLQGTLFSVAATMMFPELKPLYMVLKAFLRERELDQTRKGGVCSFMLVNMIVYFLQHQYKKGKVGQMLHIHLYEFFRYFALEFNTRCLGISVRAGGFSFQKDDEALCKEARLDGKLLIESPLCVIEDVACGAFNYGLVKKHFKLAISLMEQRGFQGESLIQLIVDPVKFQNFKEE